MRSLSIVAAALVGSGSLAVASPSHSGWNLKKFRSLVAFGDSFTDEQRLGYFGSHNGDAPPVGRCCPAKSKKMTVSQTFSTSSGGRIWDRYVATYTGANLYDYAVSGAVCSNAISPRVWSTIKAPFPAVKEYEIPAFLADSALYNTTTRQRFLDVPSSETVYAIWIGTNDLGNDAFLTDSQIKGKTLVDYVNCVYESLDMLYKHGGRYFVLMNVAPLQLLPQYAPPEAGGLPSTKFYPNKGSNITEISYRIKESVVTVNGIFEYKTPYEVKVARRYPGAHIALFDTYSLISDMYYNPARYLNGTASPNVTGFSNVCSNGFSGCVVASSPDSYLWFDELHPSEQTGRQIARAFIDVVKGRSKWATYWG